MLLFLVGTVTSSRPSPGIVLGKSVDFRLNKNWRPQNSHDQGTKPAISSDVTDDEDLIIEGSGSETDPSGLHSLAGTHMSCCSIGYAFGKNGIHCNAELHYNRLATVPVDGRNRYGERLKTHLKKHGTDIKVTVFKKCFERRPGEFHKCCYVAKKEKEMTTRWQSNRRNIHASDKRYISWRFVKG
ncbi:hypothetical protein SNE40_019565 [Patella caerulea]|uniref:Uncharacterized protein n=1 Tax=Patella caerulea TaxID=87958 RepID=A0AAN8P9T4_PATCE